jgi:hypothetical protein
MKIFMKDEIWHDIDCDLSPTVISPRNQYEISMYNIRLDSELGPFLYKYKGVSANFLISVADTVYIFT